MSGCKHGHEANSCTSCYAERRIEQLTADRAVLEKALSATRDEADQMKHVVSELEAERDALKAQAEGCRRFHMNAEAVRNENAKLSGLLDHQTAEVERLRAEIEEQRAIAAECDHIREQAVADFMAHPMDETDYEGQLRELREAAEAYRELTRRAFEQDEDESCNSATTAERDRAHAIYQRFVDVLAKVKP